MSYFCVRVAVALIPLALVISGCGLAAKDAGGQSSDYNLGKACVEFSDFLGKDLSMPVEYANTSQFSKPVNLGGSCFASHVNGPNAGHMDITHMVGENATEPSPPYELQSGFKQKVWMAPGNKIWVADGSWVVSMELFDAQLTDTQTREAVEFLVEVAHEVRGAAS